MTVESLLVTILIALGVIWIVQTIVNIVYCARLKKDFTVAVNNMKIDNNDQKNRVDGLVRQYRALTKDSASKFKIVDKLAEDLQDLHDYVTDELAERVDEVDLSVSAILDNDWEDDEEEETVYVAPQPKPQPQPVPVVSQTRKTTSQPKQQANGLTTKNGTQYDRFMELRAQGYSALEATAMLKNGTAPKKGGKRA